MAKYIYEHKNWTNFSWKEKVINTIFGEVRLMQGKIIGQMNMLGVSAKEDSEGFMTRLQQVIRIIVEYDMSSQKDFDIRNARKLLQLLYILSGNLPYKPNISELTRKSEIYRNIITGYLNYLEQAQLIRQLYPTGVSISKLQKPEKIYLDNTNLAYVLATNTTDRSNLRATFFASQLSVNHKLSLPKYGDFMVDNKWVFQIGTRYKDKEQIMDVPNSFVEADEWDYPVSVLPLWVFGMLY